MLDRGAKINAKTDGGIRPLTLAAQGGHAEIVRALLDKGAEVNAESKDGWPALSLAAANGHTDTVRALLDAGADVTAKAKNGGTALLVAASKGNSDIVELLNKPGASTSAPTDTMRAPGTSTIVGAELLRTTPSQSDAVQQKPLHVEGDIKAPSRVKDVPPVYPDIAKWVRVQGIVILEAIIDPRGGVYFSDPRYGDKEGVEQDGFHVYYIRPDRAVVRVIDNLDTPNGVMGTKDGKLLYVADAGGSKTYVYRVQDDGSLTDRKQIAPEGSDGMTLDERGNLYLTRAAVHVYSPEGERISTISVPEQPSNVTFAGKDGKTLFITARTGFYSLRMNVRGQ